MTELTVCSFQPLQPCAAQNWTPTARVVSRTVAFHPIPKSKIAFHPIPKSKIAFHPMHKSMIAFHDWVWRRAAPTMLQMT